MSRPLEDGCSCGRAWRWFRVACAWIGYPLMALGFVVALPGMLVTGLGEIVIELPWARSSPGRGEP